MSSKKKIENWLIGADPEFFLKDKNGIFKTAIGLIGGTKEEPIKIDNGCALQEDNVMVEFCIPPARTAVELSNSIEYVKNHIQKLIKPKDLEIAIVPSAKFTKEDLNNFQAQLFGCDPDFSAWEMMMNEPPIVTSEQLIRCAGGHIHLGYDNPSEDQSIQVIRAMDLFLGIPSILMDRDRDRRTMYGKAGCFRPKPYGFEYRTLSNFWISSKRNIEWVVESIEKTINFINDDNTIDETYGGKIQECINKQNIELATEIAKECSLNVLELTEV